MDMYKLMKPILLSWPYPDFGSIIEINQTRNKAAHSYEIDKVSYKNRNPFRDSDCLSQMYFDVWAIKQEMTKFSWKAIERPDMVARAYSDKYGGIGISQEVIDSVRGWFDEITTIEEPATS